MGAKSIDITPEPQVPAGVTSRFNIDYLGTWEWIAESGTHALHLFDTQETDTSGRNRLAYAVEIDGERIYANADFYAGMGIAIDSDESAASLIELLAYTPGRPCDEDELAAWAASLEGEDT